MASASTTTVARAGSLKVGDYAMVKGKPCRVLRASAIKTGKHGHAKAAIQGKGLFDGLRYDETFRAHQHVAVPVVTSTAFDLVDVSADGAATLLANDGCLREDLVLDAAARSDHATIRDQLLRDSIVTVRVVAACNMEMIMAA